MKHVFELTVRSTDIDFIGHVNNAKYLEYMEWARVDWISQMGFPIEVLQEMQLLPVVVHISINYRKELKMLEQVKVISSLTRLGEKSYVIRQELYNQNGELASDADFTMVMIDARARRAVVFPEKYLQALKTALATNDENK